MAARDRAVLRGRARRALVRPVPVAAGVLGLAFACLNPQPDEEPTFNGSKQPGPGTIDVAPQQETCNDNPLLAGCAVTAGQTPADSPGAGGSASTGGNANGGAAGSAGTAGSAGSAGSGADAGERDAGPDDAERGAADAG